MNFKINNAFAAFGANYTINGKPSAQETSEVYDEQIKKLQRNRQIAVKAQEYMQSDHIQQRIESLPEHSYVRLNTGVYDGKSERKDNILGFTPFLSFEPTQIEQFGKFNKQYGKNSDILKLSLKQDGELSTDSIDNCFTKLLDFYC
jgi:hypothetical protein